MSSSVAFRPELKGAPKPEKRGYQNDTSREAQEWYLANDMCPTVMYSNDRSMRFWICAKPIKTEGADKCNTHLGVDKRNEKKEAIRAARKDEDVMRRVSAQKYCDRLEALGVQASPDYSGLMNTYTGGIAIPAKYLDRLMTLIDKEWIL